MLHHFTLIIARTALFELAMGVVSGCIVVIFLSAFLVSGVVLAHVSVVPCTTIQVTEVKMLARDWNISLRWLQFISWRTSESLPLKALAVTFLKWVLFGVQCPSPMLDYLKQNKTKNILMSKAKALNVIQLFYEQFGLFLFLFFRIENFRFSLEKLIYV